MAFHELIEVLTRAIEGAGVVIVALGAAVATALFARQLRAGTPFCEAYDLYRQWLGRAILLGLEFLVAADIVGTVTISPTLTSVTILAAIVLIRTFLSMSLSVEIEGRWPWQRVEAELPRAA